MKTIIGLTGVKGSGKTTSFDILKELNSTITEITLANKLKNVSAEVFKIPRSHFDDPRFKEKELEVPAVFTQEAVIKIIELFETSYDFDKHVRPHIGKVLHTPRQIAQYVGSEVMRSIDEQIHCKWAVKGISEQGLFVVTDMRFWNEFHFFADNTEVKFVPVYISNYAAEARSAQDTHQSERYVQDIGKKCQRVDNNGTIAELREKLTSIISQIK